MAKPTAVVFDLDGTLADSVLDIAGALNAALRDARLGTIEPDAVRLMIGRGPDVLVQRALRHIGVIPDRALVDRLTDGFVTNHHRLGNHKTTLFPGVRRCLVELRDKGILVGVCSNKPDELCGELLDELQITQLVQATQGSSKTVPRKPDPTMLQTVLDSLGAGRETAVYVGDSKTDLETGRAAAVPVVLVTYGYSDVPAANLGADLVLDTLDALPARLESINSNRTATDPPPLRSATP